MHPEGESAESSDSEGPCCIDWVADVGFIKNVRAGFQQNFEIDKCIP